jgi:hypothetical protein
LERRIKLYYKAAAEPELFTGEECDKLSAPAETTHPPDLMF